MVENLGGNDEEETAAGSDLRSCEPKAKRDFASNAEITRQLIKHRSYLYGYILSCVRNHNDAEEVFQEVSVGVVTSFHKLRTPDEFLPWAIEISRRQVLSFFRRSKRPLMYDSDLVGMLAEVASRHDTSEAAENRARVLRGCLEKLPEHSRYILMLRYSQRFAGVAEIAAYLDRSMAATYGVLKRIRTALRKCVEENLPAEARE